MIKQEFLSKESLQNRLIVCTTLRKKKEILLGGLPLGTKVLSVGEFVNRAIFTQDSYQASTILRKLILRKAVDKNDLKELKIPDEFFKFLKNSDFFLRFFDELALDFVPINTLDTLDCYQDYEEHLKIIESLHQKYQALLAQNKLSDKSTLAQMGKINTDFLKNFEHIDVYFDGYLSRFEQDFYEKISTHISLDFHIELTKYDNKLQNLFDLRLEKSAQNSINLRSKNIKKTQKSPPNLYAYKLYAPNKLSQIQEIKKALFYLEKSKISLEKTALILCDESFAGDIYLFDDEQNFNLASGIQFSQSLIFKFLKAKFLYIKDPTKINQERLKTFGEMFLKDSLKDNLQEVLQKNLSQNMPQNLSLTQEETLQFLQDLNENLPKEESEIYLDELFKLRQIIKDDALSQKEILGLFLENLSQKSLSHKGGVVSVLGVLETRQMSFDGLIIVDFSSDFVPKESVKDLFINSNIRKKAGLTTNQDRQNYQKSLWQKLISKAKQTYIISTQNSAQTPSKFLRSLDIKDLNLETNINISLLKSKHFIKKQEQEITLEINLKDFVFSNSSLKTYLDCKRKFYHRYIQKLYPKEKTNPIGTYIHNILCEIENNQNLEDLNNLWQEKTIQFIDNKPLYFELNLWQKKLQNMFKTHLKRQKEGFEIYKKEVKNYSTLNGFKIEGRADRIDKIGNKYVILDYKSGKIQTTTAKTIANTTDFGLIFYYLLFKDSLNIDELFLWYLDDNLLKKEEFLPEKLELLTKHFDTLAKKEQVFSKTDRADTCRYCEFAIICEKRFF